MSQLSSSARYVVFCAAAVLPAFLALYAFLPYTYSHLGAGAQLVSVFQALWIMWERFPDFQHGMIVPLLAGVLVYTRRDKLAGLPIQGWYPAILLVALSLAVYWVGRRVDNQYLGFFSIQLLLGSLTLFLLGWKWFWQLAFPILFLIFSWPLPFLDNYVAFPLRMFMSAASVTVLQIMGVDAIKQGTAIVSAPNPDIGLAAGQAFAVDVADPCSGIRSLFALMMISALFANFTLKSPWKRMIVFLSSIPLAVAGNLVRILLLTVGTIIMGPEIAIGTLEHPTIYHMVSGYAVFLVALVGMMVLSSLLKWKPREARKAFEAFVKKATPPRSEPLPASRTSDLY